MATFWTRPSIFNQYSETDAEDSHISWSLPSNTNTSFSTVGSLYHISRAPKHDILSKTYYLTATGFAFVNLPVTVTGIELRIISKRGGRIMDDIIQLYNDGKVVGENKASAIIHPSKIYGGASDLWKSNMNRAKIESSNFGIALRFQSHPNWPHKDPMLVEFIELRIH